MKTGTINVGYLRAGMLLLPAAILSACVTINIYFPAAAAEKAADKIIEEVWQLEDQSPSEQRPDEPTNSDTPAK